MIFENANESQSKEILALYDSVRGVGFCVWDESYPTMREIKQDLQTNNLYVLTENGRIAGALSVMPENEMDTLDVWRMCDGTQAEIARIVVGEDFRGRGLAGIMVDSITEILRERGYRAIHISAAVGNLPALATYKKRGFEIMGREHIYGGEFFLLEKLIASDTV